MFNFNSPSTPVKHRAQAPLDAPLDTLLRGVSFYVLPLLIGAATLLALLVWPSMYSTDGARLVKLRSFSQQAESVTPAQAVTRLAAEPAADYRETRLVESPFWLQFEVQPDAHESVLIELPSRHAVQAECWNAATLQPLGSAGKASATGAMRPARAGFAITLGQLQASVSVLCQASFVGPARISAVQWRTDGFEQAAQEFHRKSGLLDGGVIMLALFALMTALINRAPVYVLFAVWLVFNLRMGTISAGWDTQWLGAVVPTDWLSASRLLTFAGFYAITGMLFRQLFREELIRFGFDWAMRLVHSISLVLIPAALLLPYAIGLPVMWAAGSVSIAALFFFLIRILTKTKSTVAGWYGGALVITLAATLYEVAAAAIGAKQLIGSVNSVTAALSSSLMAAFAIAEQIRLERQQRMRAESQLRSAYEVIPVGLFTLSDRGNLVSANPALRQMLELEAAAAGPRWENYFVEGAWGKLKYLLAANGAAEMEMAGASPAAGNEQKRFLVKAAMSGDRIEGSLQDITDKSKALERLHFLAENDPLTGVLNRRGIERRLEAALKEIDDAHPLAVAYLDLDRFKLINDLYGHAAGDEVLRQVCERVAEMLTPGQEVGRIGGDEFVILFQGTPIRPAIWTCRGIIERIAAQSYLVGEKAFQIGGSIGLVEAETGARAKDVIAAADQGCREAKRSYDDRLVVYERSSAVFAEREADLRLIERITHADGPQGLFLQMQPLLSTRDPFTALDFEVLLRMRDADDSLIEAGHFIPLAEDKGCIGIIDRWVLTSTLEWLNEHGDGLVNTRFVCMNLSGASLNDEHFIEEALALMARFPQSARRLCIEITESVALHDLANMRRFIDTVRRAGARVALDDFGAGYTSFSYLRDLPADVLKIDGAFIRGVNSHPANLAIVDAIVTLARSLGMKTIGEWAEDRATVQTLVEVGIDFIQGYAVARPQAPEAILAADSAASFIQEERLLKYVYSMVADSDDLSLQLWDDQGPVNPGDLH